MSIPINPKHVKNLDLLDMNFHTVTKPELLKMQIENINKYF